MDGIVKKQLVDSMAADFEEEVVERYGKTYTEVDILNRLVARVSGIEVQRIEDGEFLNKIIKCQTEMYEAMIKIDKVLISTRNGAAGLYEGCVKLEQNIIQFQTGVIESLKNMAGVQLRQEAKIREMEEKLELILNVIKSKS